MKDKLIAEQQLEIRELKALLKECWDINKSIYCALYGVGAPLNDNSIGLNEKQFKYFEIYIGRGVRELDDAIVNYLEEEGNE